MERRVGPSESASAAEHAFARYIDRFNAADPAGIAACFSYPHCRITGERGLQVAERAEANTANFERLLARLRDQGWVRSRVDELSSWALSASLVQLVAKVSRLRDDGSVLDTAGAAYLFRGEESGWRIVAVAPIADAYGP